ncbi:MAG: GGDEF domain-containing phosphodiesterase [Rubrivivax sp.]|nr:GGDEF domain-containing phosphodiesterase [Rubrivivax sp.]
MPHAPALRGLSTAAAAGAAEHDLLTGALAAEPFERALQQACNDAAPGAASALALLCIELDALPAAPQANSHAAAQTRLRSAAAGLQPALQQHETLGRLPGDRLALLLPLAAEAGATQAISARVQQLFAVLAEPACIGVAVMGIDGHDAAALLHKATLALVRAQSQRGRAALPAAGSWSFHDPALDGHMQDRLQDRRALAQDLRHALQHGWLRLHYQPVLGADGTLCGYEALARWPHATRGFVPPQEFVAVAEISGQMDRLGRWVLDTACAEAASWGSRLTLAVNLSAAQCRQGPRLVDSVASALATSGLPAQRLQLEITERLLLQPSAPVLETLSALHRLGVQIVMDDFGTGQASLACLWHLPLAKLKIDASLTHSVGQDARADAIVRSIVQMAQPLGIRVAAEGVETEVQRLALRRLGCDELQGQHLGHPAPVQRLPHREAEVAAVLVRGVERV